MLTGHLYAADLQIGELLIPTPADEHLWIDESVARELDAKENVDLRRGFSIGTQNQRGAHWGDPKGKPEFDMSNDYRKKAVAVEKLGLRRFGENLRQIADDYKRQGQQIVRREGFWADE